MADIKWAARLIPSHKSLYTHIKEENTIIFAVYGQLCTNHLMQHRELTIHKEYSMPNEQVIVCLSNTMTA